MGGKPVPAGGEAPARVPDLGAIGMPDPARCCGTVLQPNPARRLSGHGRRHRELDGCQPAQLRPGPSWRPDENTCASGRAVGCSRAQPCGVWMGARSRWSRCCCLRSWGIRIVSVRVGRRRRRSVRRHRRCWARRCRRRGLTLEPGIEAPSARPDARPSPAAIKITSVAPPGDVAGRCRPGPANRHVETVLASGDFACFAPAGSPSAQAAAAVHRRSSAHRSRLRSARPSARWAFRRDQGFGPAMGVRQVCPERGVQAELQVSRQPAFGNGLQARARASILRPRELGAPSAKHWTRHHREFRRIAAGQSCLLVSDRGEVRRTLPPRISSRPRHRLAVVFGPG